MKKILFFLLFCFTISITARAQQVGGNAYLQGQYVEVGINQCGGWGTTNSAPAGYHARSGNSFTNAGDGQQNLGFVADPDKDGWTVGSPNKYNGDYFMPAAPYCAWAISFNTTNNGTDRAYNTDSTTCGNTYSSATITHFPGSIQSVVSASGYMQAIWQGTSGGLQVSKIITIKSTKLYFTIKVVLKNTSASSITNIYYGDGVNPDNDYFYMDVNSGNLNTKNTIVYQNPTDGKSLVTALGSTTQSYLGLGSKDCRSKALTGSGVYATPESSAANWYAGSASSGLQTTTYSTSYSNYPIAIAFNIGTIAAGDSTEFSYTYILKSTDYDEALSETAPGFSVNGVTHKSNDTVNVCSGSSTTLTITNGSFFSWSYSPSSTLSSSTGLSVTATPTATTTYIATGTSSSCTTVYDTITLKTYTARLYVDSSITTSGSGGTWATAFKTVNEALAVANALPCVNEVWVKKGTYFPTITPSVTVASSRDSSFRILRSGLKIYGGFSGTETAITQRVAGNTTTLSGDIGVVGDSTDNSYHVITVVGTSTSNIDTTTRLDGLAITAANGNGAGSFPVNTQNIYRERGGGLYLEGEGTGNNCSPALVNLNINRNHTQNNGGGIEMWAPGGNTSPYIYSCTLANNSCNSGAGIIMEADANSTMLPIFLADTFINNIAVSEGGGLYMNSSSSVNCNWSMNKCLFTANKITSNTGYDYGASMCLFGANTPNIKNSSFISNISNSFAGGFMCFGSTGLNIDSSIFTGNKSSYSGAVFDNISCAINVTNSTFNANYVNGSGSIGITYFGAGSYNFNNCSFVNDTATGSGSLIYNGSSQANSLVMTNCKVLNNYGGTAGVFQNNAGGTITSTNTVFAGNIAGQLGGVVNNANGKSIFNNSVLYNNRTSGTGNIGGGVAHTYQLDTLIFNDCTLYNNTTASSSTPNANTFSNDSAGVIILNNSIVWGTAANQVAGIGSYLNNYSDIKGVIAAGTNLNIDPLFVNPSNPIGADNIWGTTDDGLKLLPCSPAINTGSNALIPTGIVNDFAGTARIQQSIVDMGAYEQVTTPYTRLYVDSSVATSGTGASWASPLKTLREALNNINYSNCALEVWVKKGTYFPTSDNNRDSSFRILRNGTKVYGGFAGTETSITQRVAGNNTILSGDIGVAGDSTDNTYHVVTYVATPTVKIDSTTQLDGVTVTLGNGTGSSNFTVNSQTFNQTDGGGIFLCGINTGDSCSPKLSNILFTKNNARYGGALYLASYFGGASSPVIDNCTFSYNNALTYGGALLSYSITLSNSPIIRYSTFNGNYISPVATGTNSGGAAIYSRQTNFKINNCSITNNSADCAAGFKLEAGKSVINNCSFTGNNVTSYSVNVTTYATGESFVTAGSCGYHGNGDSSIYNNCIFSGNTGSTGGGVAAISNVATPFVTLNNCIIQNNNVIGSGAALYSYFSTINVNNTFIANNTASTNCIGGAVRNRGGTFNFNQCVLANNADNNTSGGAGAVETVTGATTNFYDCTLSNNSSANSAVGNSFNVNGATSSLNLYNTIVWGNAATQITSTGITTYSYSDPKGITAAGTNINANPQFINPSNAIGADNIWGTADDGLRLSPCSPAINAGSNALIPAGITTDIKGAARIQNTTVDMGAYEAPYNSTGLPKDTITLSSASTTICAGQNETFTTTTTAPGSSPTYQWFKNNMPIAGATSSTYSTSVINNNDSFYVVHYNNDCNLYDTSNRTGITIKPSPATPVVTSNSPLCQGGTINLSTSAVTGATYAYTGPNSFTSTAQNPTISNAQPIASGVYSAVITVNGCPSQAGTVTVVVNANPTFTVSSTNPTTCSGTNGSITLNGLNANVSYALSYNKNSTVNTATVTSNVSGSITISNLSSATYSAIFVTLNGCTSASAGPITLSDPSTPATPTFTTNSPVCSGNALNFNTASVTGATYSYTGPNSYTSSAQNPTLASAQTNMSGTYSLTVTVAGCTSAPGTSAVTVKPTPNISSVISSNPTTCSGTNGYLVLSGLSSNTAYSINYNKNGSAQTATLTSNSSGLDTISNLNSAIYNNITATLNGCTSNVAGPFTLSDPPIPATPVPTVNTPVCSGSTLNFNTAAVNNGTYSWSGPSAFSSASQSPSINNAQTTNSGSYSVTVTVANCTSAPGSVNAVVNQTPSISGTNSTNPTTCLGSNGTITLSGLANSTAYTVTYMKGSVSQTVNVTSNSSGNVVISGLSSGTYTSFATATASCTSNTISSIITLSDPPPPSAAVSASGPLTFCQGNSVTLTTSTGSGYVYTWYKNGFSVSGATTNTYSPLTSGTYTVSITDANLCSATSSNNVVTVNPLPIVTASAASSTTFCQGYNVLLSATSSTAINYQWKQGGTSINGATNTNYSANTTGNYTVTVQDANTCVNTSNAISVTVNPKPVVTTSASGPLTFCLGNRVILSANSGAGLTYQWSNSGSYITNATNQNDTAYFSGAYKVIETNSFNCQDSSAAINVTANPLPIAAITPAGTLTTCANVPLTLYAATASNLTYQWLINGSNIGGATTSNYTITSTAKYGLLVTNQYGCQASAADSVTVYPIPPVGVISAAGPTTICLGDTVALSTTAIANISYVWQLNGTNLTSSSNSYNAQLSGNYTVSLTNSFNCTTISAPVSVTVNPIPINTITYNAPIAFCLGSGVVLNSLQQTGTHYQWLLNSLAINDTTYSYLATTAGSYQMKMTNTYGCTDLSAPVTITVYPLPTPIISTNGNYVTTGIFLTYQWFFNGQAITNGTNRNQLITLNGAYQVVVTDTNGCQGRSSVQFVKLGINSTVSSDDIMVFPNPAMEKVFIKAPVKVNITLMDIRGSILFKEKDITEINISSYADGDYMILIFDEQNNLLKKVKVQKMTN